MELLNLGVGLPLNVLKRLYLGTEALSGISDIDRKGAKLKNVEQTEQSKHPSRCTITPPDIENINRIIKALATSWLCLS